MHPISNILIIPKNQCGQNSFVWSHFNWSSISTSSKLNMKFNSSITKYTARYFFTWADLKWWMIRYKGHLRITTVNGCYIKLTNDPAYDAISIQRPSVPWGTVTFSVVSMFKHHYYLCFEIIMIISPDFTHSCFYFPSRVKGIS